MQGKACGTHTTEDANLPCASGELLELMNSTNQYLSLYASWGTFPILSQCRHPGLSVCGTQPKPPGKTSGIEKKTGQSTPRIIAHRFKITSFISLYIVIELPALVLVKIHTLEFRNPSAELVLPQNGTLSSSGTGCSTYKQHKLSFKCPQG